MADVSACVDGWRDVQANPRTLAHGKKLLNGVSSWSAEAGQMVKYLGEFVGLTCAPDMLALRVFPNAKEISESFGAYEAVRYRLPNFQLNDPSVTVICVGDGCTPRTGATFALRSAWTVHSVDPKLKGGTRRWAAIKRLNLHVSRIEDVRIRADRAILVAVHSHANLARSVAAIEANELAVVAIPCCVSMALHREPDLQYEDKGIISPCRTVKVWRDVCQREKGGE